MLMFFSYFSFRLPAVILHGKWQRLSTAQTNKQNIYAAGQLFTPKVTEGERKVGKI